MNNVGKTRGFDEDFLWLFRKIERPIICLSIEYHVVALTPSAEKLFAVGKNILNKPIDSLFAHLGLKITFSQNSQHIVIHKFDSNITSNLVEEILKLNWEIKQKGTAGGKLSGYIMYTEEHATSRVPIFDDKNSVLGVVGVAVDISDRKGAEILSNEKEVAEKTSKFMQRLIGSIAHEIRTPLAIIGINVDLLKRTQCFTASKEDKEKVKYFKTIKYAIRLASRIIDNILVMIKTLSFKNSDEIEFQRLSMAESVQSVLELYPFLDHERALISFDKSKDFIYYGDETLTQHMLFNLIKNALLSIKEAERGEIKIKLEPGRPNNNLIFIDTALGISEKELPYIFDRFDFGIKKAGAGLGLAFCKMVMQSYGGDIDCVSKLGKYAEFILSFPVFIVKRLQKNINGS